MFICLKSSNIEGNLGRSASYLISVVYYTGRFIKNQQKYAKTNTVIYKCMEK